MLPPTLACSLGLNWIQVSLEVISLWLTCSGRLYGLKGVCFLSPVVLVALGVLWIVGGRLKSPTLLFDFLFPDLVACELLFMELSPSKVIQCPCPHSVLGLGIVLRRSPLSNGRRSIGGEGGDVAWR